MERPNTYRGEKNYIFVSYSHKDTEKVWPIILRMQKDGYRIWYDDSIRPGSEWDENIAKHVRRCTCFYAFISENYLDSGNCIDELTCALNKKNEERQNKEREKNLLLIYLEEVTLSEGKAMRLSRIQAIYKCRISDEIFYKKLYGAEGIESCLGTDLYNVGEIEKKESLSDGETVKYFFSERNIEKSTKNGRGPERPRYSKKDVVDHAVFNSVVDNDIWGNEGHFVRIAEKKPSALYTNSLTLEVGKKYEVLIYFNNNASCEYNDKVHDNVGFAWNVRMAVKFPDLLMKDERGEITAKITSTNTEPKEVWDGVYITAKEDMILNYEIASAKIYNDWDVSGQILSTNLFSEKGTFIGLLELDGTIPGGNQYSGQVIVTIVTKEYKEDEQQYQTGMKYDYGMGVEEDWKQAAEWYEKAAAQGNALAQYNLGSMYGQGKGIEQNFAEEVKWYQRAAKQGNIKAQYNLGVRYKQGKGIEKNIDEAVKWYRRAGKKGNINAQSVLGQMYRDGVGIEQNAKEAVKWFQMAAEQGGVDAQACLGWMYEWGKGVEQNFEEAVKWYQSAAEQGNAAAQNNLGRMYENGKGVQKNAEEAVKWYRKAAEQDYAVAQGHLGRMYEEGTGIRKNTPEAIKWYKKALANGETEVQERLRNLEVKNKVERLKWQAAAGDVSAHLKLNDYYRYGKFLD